MIAKKLIFDKQSSSLQDQQIQTNYFQNCVPQDDEEKRKQKKGSLSNNQNGYSLQINILTRPIIVKSSSYLSFLSFLKIHQIPQPAQKQQEKSNRFHDKQSIYNHRPLQHQYDNTLYNFLNIPQLYSFQQKLQANNHKQKSLFFYLCYIENIIQRYFANADLYLKILLRFSFNLKSQNRMTANTREEHLYMAKITEQTERFEDMLDAMNKVVAANADLTVEERNLLSVAYKNTIGSRRTAWRALSSIEKKEEQKGSKNLGLLRGYKAKIEGELNKYCNEILNLIDSKLITSASNAEAKVFYFKMKGDYYRYISEYTSGKEHDKAGDNAHEAYKAATESAEASLKTTHPIRLGLALNYSVFHYEVKNDPSKACQLAKQAFDDAIADIDQIEEDQYKDATTIMQLIRDNLTLWTSELEEDGDK